MALLRILLGSLTSTVLRLALTLGALLLVYLLLIKPALDSAGETVHRKGEKLMHCVEHANGSARRLQRCARRF